MAVNKYTRRKAEQLTANFKSTEFDCKGKSCGCVVTRVDSKLVRKLQVLRNHARTAVTITSGNRCVTHNRACGGTSSSYHLNSSGKAADIVVKGISPEEIAKLAQEIGFTGIGMYNGSAGRFVHVDTRPGKYYWKNTSGRNVTVSTHGSVRRTCPYILSGVTLRKGCAGDSVKALQWIIDWCGYPCEDDGIFGEKTDAALRQFQSDMCLEVDGIAGKNTLAALREVSS